MTDRLEQYQVLGQIGEGSFGRVHKGRVKSTAQIVALKFISKRGKSQKDLANLRQQIDILKKLKHQNIVLLIDSFQMSHQFVLVTELAHGQLYDIIQADKSLNQSDVRKVAQQLVKALHYLHSNRVIHRDMKPHNILIGANGSIKLCDFGFARVLSYTTQVLTSVKGTPLYMAPQLCNSLPYNHTADLWSLGVILYQLYLGYPPYYASHWSQLFEIIKTQPLKIPEGINPHFKSLIKGLLNKTPSERLSWPDLLVHPFVAETQDDRKISRPLLRDKLLQRTRSRSRTPNNSILYQRDLSPRRSPCKDDFWNKQESAARDQRGAQSLRSDSTFLNKLIQALTLNPQQHKATIHTSIKVLLLVLFQKQSPGKLDVTKNNRIPNLLINLIKKLLQKLAFYMELVSDSVKAIGILGKNSYQKIFGTDNSSCSAFLPLVGQLMDVCKPHSQFQILIVNVIKTVGLFANQSSSNTSKSRQFYKDMVKFKIVQHFSHILFQSKNNTLIKLVTHVFAVILHPIYGEVEPFPYWSQPASVPFQRSQFQDIEVLRQRVSEVLLDNQFLLIFVQQYKGQEDRQLTRLSLLRLISFLLRNLRQVVERPTWYKVQKILVQNLSADTDNLQFVATSVSISLMEKPIQLMSQYVPDLLNRIQKNKNSNLLQCLCSLSVLQWLINQQGVFKYFQGNFKWILQTLQQINSKTLNQLEQIRKLEGSSYSFLKVGLFDSLVSFLQKFLYRKFKEDRGLSQIEKVSLANSLFTFYNLSVYKYELSLTGVVVLNNLIHDLLLMDGMRRIGQDNFRMVVYFVKESHLKSMRQYLTFTDKSIQSMIASVLKLLQPCLSQSTVSQFCDLLPQLIEGSKFLQEDVSSLSSFLIKMYQTIQNFQGHKAKSQMIANIAKVSLRVVVQRKLMSDRFIQDGLSIVASLLRTDKVCNQGVAAICSWKQLKRYFSDVNPEVRAKMCNLVGCMSKNSDDFYETLLRTDYLKEVIRCCEDPVSSVRKFACFAVGNSAFHTQRLYQHLRQSVSALLTNLKDPDEKIRNNACGALGNLARNSGLLVKQLISHGAFPSLIRLLRDEQSLSTKRIALFALGNICFFSEAKQSVVNSGLERALQQLRGSKSFEDPMIAKYYRRLIEKMQ